MSEFKPVLLTLPSLTPSLAVEVLPYGLTVHRIIVQADGRTHDLVLGPERPEDHKLRKYTNTIVGRYANRIPVGTHQLERHGVTSTLTTLANESPRVSLHGGPEGFDVRVWEVLDSGAAELFSAAELAHLPAPAASAHAVFRLASPAGDQGFPGALRVEALVALVPPAPQPRHYRRPGAPPPDAVEYALGSVVIAYRAALAGERTVTPVNLTQHWGFNLDASLQDAPPSVLDHVLTIAADGVAALDADSLATGEAIPTASSAAHTHAAKRIGESFPENGYDDYYLFAPRATPPPPTRIPFTELTPTLDLLTDALRPAGADAPTSALVTLAGARSGLSLAFESNQAGVMFYSNNFSDPDASPRKRIHGGSGETKPGDGYKPGSAAFLEFHDPLAAFLRPENKDGADTLLTSDELYNNYVRVDVRFRESVEARE